MDWKTLKLFNSQLRCGWLLYIWNRALMAHLRVSANSEGNRIGWEEGCFLFLSRILGCVYASLYKCSVSSEWHVKPFRRERFLDFQLFT